MKEFFTNTILPWLITNGVRILIIIVVLYVAHRFIEILLAKLIKKMVKPDKFSDKDEEEQREKTLIGVMRITFHIALYIVGGMMLLSELGVNIGPLIAALGVGGLALGFGAQYLIRDIISGVFILAEGQYNEGDVVCFDKTCGTVQSINLRKTVLRDLDGAVHTVPNGEIQIASNLSDQFAKINLNVGVGYNDSIDKVEYVINQVGQAIANDREWKDKITEAPAFLRVDDFAASSITVKIVGETKPLQQWAVTGELRRRLKNAFDKEGIEIPFDQIVIHQTPSDGEKQK